MYDVLYIYIYTILYLSYIECIYIYIYMYVKNVKSIIVLYSYLVCVNRTGRGGKPTKVRDSASWM